MWIVYAMQCILISLIIIIWCKRTYIYLGGLLMHAYGRVCACVYIYADLIAVMDAPVRIYNNVDIYTRE